LFAEPAVQIGQACPLADEWPGEAVAGDMFAGDGAGGGRSREDGVEAGPLPPRRRDLKPEPAAGLIDMVDLDRHGPVGDRAVDALGPLDEDDRARADDLVPSQGVEL